jgi:hypothetical protein
MDSFENYCVRNRLTTNKVGFLIDAFREIHTNAPESDAKVLAGRMAGIYKMTQGNTEVVLKLIWRSSAERIKGSHLDYIQKAVKGYLLTVNGCKKLKLEGHAGMETD